MFHLDAVETQFGVRLDTLAASLLTRMRPDRESSRSVSDGNCLGNFESRLGNESRLSGAKKSIERLTRISNVTAFDQGARYMRPADGAAACLLHYRLESHIDPKPSEPLHNILRAHFTLVAKVHELFFELVGLRYVQREQMNLTRAIMRAQLHTADDANSERGCRKLGLLQSGQCIVIRESDRCESRCSRRIDYRRRRERSIRRGRVHVQIDLAGRPSGLPRANHFL